MVSAIAYAADLLTTDRAGLGRQRRWPANGWAERFDWADHDLRGWASAQVREAGRLDNWTVWCG